MIEVRLIHKLRDLYSSLKSVDELTRATSMINTINMGISSFWMAFATGIYSLYSALDCGVNSQKLARTFLSTLPGCVCAPFADNDLLDKRFTPTLCVLLLYENLVTPSPTLCRSAQSATSSRLNMARANKNAPFILMSVLGVVFCKHALWDSSVKGAASRLNLGFDSACHLQHWLLFEETIFQVLLTNSTFKRQ